MRFKKTQKSKYTEVTQFSGVDFSCPENRLSLDAAADMKNVYVDALGRICKRTGYKKVMQGEDCVNGIFCYEYRADGEMKKQYIVHSGTNLYFSGFVGDTLVNDLCIATDMENKKSRAFAFGDALYILGAGFYKIMWDSALGVFTCGRVCNTESDAVQNCILAENCTSNDTTFGGEKCAFIRAESLYKERRFVMQNYSFGGSNKLYIVPRDAAAKTHVVKVEYQLPDGTIRTLDPMHYQVETDQRGLYVLLKRNTSTFDERIYCAPCVVFTYNNFVYTPTNVIERSPTVLPAFGENLASDRLPMYDGEVLEGFSLSAPHRAAEFYITAENRQGGSGLRLYLESDETEGAVLRVYIDGELVQKYTAYQNGHSEPVVGSYKCQYVEFESKLLPDTDCVVRVEYVKYADDYVTDKCNVFGLFGGKNDTRVFISGNPDYPGRDYASALYDATYFPDTGYTVVGSDRSAIVGYHKISGYQVIVKDGKNFDASQYLRSYTTDAHGTAVFTIQQGAQGIGACGVSTFKSCRDRMLFAATDGVYEIRSTDVATQTNIRCLSENVRMQLEKQNLAAAVCAVQGDWYILAADTRMYILDTLRNMQWYLYADLPTVTCMFTEGDALYFGAADGCVYRFMDESEENAYYDNVGKDGSLEQSNAIEAYWDIPVTTLGCGWRRKRIEDVCIYLMPQLKGSLRVLYTTDFYTENPAHGEQVRRFDFNALDFSDFSFESGEYPICINTRAKAKHVRVFGARLCNAEPGQGMCITGFAIKYKDMNAIK